MTENQPRIAVPAPTSLDLAYNRACYPAYLAAVAQSDGTPVALEPGIPRRELLHLIASCQGIVLPGSPADVGTERYGEARMESTASADLSREEIDVAMLEAAILRKLPVLGICYGLQSVNVWRGGSLVQDLPVQPVHHAAGPAVGVAHTVALERGSLLARTYTSSQQEQEDDDRLPVNSSHHQAVRVPGDGLRVAARCPQDGCIEAVEGDETSLGFDLLAVQWHPERSFAGCATSRALFRWLVARAGA